MAFIGAAQVSRRLWGLPPNRLAADASSEAIFASITAEREVPRRLAAEIGKLPSDRPLLVLQPKGGFFTKLPSYLVAYEASPRGALIREAQLSESPGAVAELRKTFAAVVFVGQAPPASFPAGERFGDSFVFVPLAAREP